MSLTDYKIGFILRYDPYDDDNDAAIRRSKDYCKENELSPKAVRIIDHEGAILVVRK